MGSPRKGEQYSERLEKQCAERYADPVSLVAAVRDSRQFGSSAVVEIRRIQ